MREALVWISVVALIAVPFALIRLVTVLAASHVQTPAEPRGGRVHWPGVLAHASFWLPFTILPAFIGNGFVLRWLVDTDVLSPYPPPDFAVWATAAVPLLGVVFGLASLAQNTRHPDRLRDRRRAVEGIVLSWYAGILLVVLVRPVVDSAVQSDRKSLCLSHVKGLTTALSMYASDNAGALPAAHWSEAVQPYVPPGDDLIFVCPSARKLPCGYAFNRALRSAPLDRIVGSASVISIFESDRGWNATGGPELLPDVPRHLTGDDYGFADGHATWIRRNDVLAGAGQQYRWNGEIDARPEAPPTSPALPPP